MSAASTREFPADSLDGLWSEAGDRVWLRLDYGEDATRVKRKFFLGVGLPTTPGRDGADYRRVQVRRAFIRPGEPDEWGWAGKGDETWWKCEADHPKSVEAWEVGYA